MLPAFAIHTYRTDDGMRSETSTIDVNQSTISGSREAGNGRERQNLDGAQRFSRSDFNCSALACTASRLTELRDTPTVCAISGRTSSYSRVETPRKERIGRAQRLLGK